MIRVSLVRVDAADEGAPRDMLGCTALWGSDTGRLGPFQASMAVDFCGAAAAALEPDGADAVAGLAFSFVARLCAGDADLSLSYSSSYETFSSSMTSMSGILQCVRNRPRRVSISKLIS